MSASDIELAIRSVLQALPDRPRKTVSFRPEDLHAPGGTRASCRHSQCDLHEESP